MPRIPRDPSGAAVNMTIRLSPAALAGLDAVRGTGETRAQAARRLIEQGLDSGAAPPTRTSSRPPSGRAAGKKGKAAEHSVPDGKLRCERCGATAIAIRNGADCGGG